MQKRIACEHAGGAWLRRVVSKSLIINDVAISQSWHGSGLSVELLCQPAAIRQASAS
jgi:hypothetical protein